MEFGQILQVVLSLGVVALALYLSTRLARRRFGAGGVDALRVVSRQSVSRTQNLVVVETNGHRHLVAFTDGGAHTVETWDAPAPAAERAGAADERQPSHRAAPRPAVQLPALRLPAAPLNPFGRGAARRAADRGPRGGQRPDGHLADGAPTSRRAVARQEASRPAPRGTRSFAETLADLTAGTQWTGLGRTVPAAGTEPSPVGPHATAGPGVGPFPANDIDAVSEGARP
jgi:flagellar biogenesis protein FliO